MNWGEITMIGVLFWNVHRNNLSQSVGRIAAASANRIRIVVLAESVTRHRYDTGLTAATGMQFLELLVPGCRFIKVLTTLPTSRLSVARAGTRYAILRLRMPRKPELLLAIAHLPAKGPGPNSVDNQRSVAQDLWKEIRSQELLYGHGRSVLVGDLNMNPFETGMISSDGLHATMSRTVAAKSSRRVNGIDRGPLFFNPMWQHWGDAKVGPPGTYYKSCSSTDCLFWHLFDQVVLRHDANVLFDHASLRILDGDGHESFRSKNGIPRKKIFSDHLPLVFQLKV